MIFSDGLFVCSAGMLCVSGCWGFGCVDLKLGFHIRWYIGGVKGKGKDGEEEQTFFHGNVWDVIGISGQIVQCFESEILQTDCHFI